MGKIGEQLETTAAAPVRCVICGSMNETMRYCRHVRWTFDQGDPIDFARFAIETSPYVTARGGKSSDISKKWWALNGAWVVEQVQLHFDAADGYVFGEIADLDLLARDIWKQFRPDPERPAMARY
ncbi:MAG: hypothetical protein EPO22_03345 [Dehalococcoidia bacterium]|nr:MAG: hypothetical protein EPO22_03345 [Dehalococcoidia bacterium]